MEPLDAYSRAARLTPLLLAAAPIPVTGLALGWQRFDWLTSIVAFACSWFVGVLAAQLVRDAGKRIEPDLFTSWGGPPTTVLLRHRGPLRPTVRQHHHTNIHHATGLPLPTPSAEESDPATADDTYAAAVVTLRELTRDRGRFPALFSELANYGLRRNLLGLRRLGSLIAAACALLAGGALTAEATSPTPLSAVGLLLALATDLSILTAWRLYVTPHWVREAAFDYAERLLHASSALEPRTRKD